MAFFRIIPAHAGFTPSTTGAATGWSDHPRMRGVYGDALGHQPRTSGSSPRARGLPRQNVRAAGVLRIIPACAGFTPGPTSPRRPDPDHPRMRGVYASRYDSDGKRRGSSPHARGLRGGHGGLGRHHRIIPACAGFTCAAPTWWPRRTDHPRMRGVYWAKQRVTPSVTGSSPHARGLR